MRFECWTEDFAGKRLANVKTEEGLLLQGTSLSDKQAIYEAVDKLLDVESENDSE